MRHGDNGGHGNPDYPEVVARCICGRSFGPGWRNAVWTALADHIDAHGGNALANYPWLRGQAIPESWHNGPVV